MSSHEPACRAPAVHGQPVSVDAAPGPVGVSTDRRAATATDDGTAAQQGARDGALSAGADGNAHLSSAAGATSGPPRSDAGSASVAGASTVADGAGMRRIAGLALPALVVLAAEPLYVL